MMEAFSLQPSQPFHSQASGLGTDELVSQRSPLDVPHFNSPSALLQGETSMMDASIMPFATTEAILFQDEAIVITPALSTTTKQNPQNTLPVMESGQALVSMATMSQGADDLLNRQTMQTASLTGATSKGDAVLVVGERSLERADQAIADRLQSLGYEVTIRDDDRVTSQDANQKDVVVISESVISSKVGQTFTQVSTPVVNMEPFLYDDLKMTGSRKGKDFGITNGTRIQVSDDTRLSFNPRLDPGQSGSTTIYRKVGAIGWGHPNNNAIEVASVPGGNTTQSTVFGYEQGSSMVSGYAAPARRAGLYVMSRDAEASTLTNAGWQLFDQAIAWAMTQPAIATPSNVSSPTPSAPSAPSALSPSPIVDPTKMEVEESDTSTPRALFVANSWKLGQGDRAVKARLEALGYDVTVQDDNAVRSRDAKGQDIVLISESVDSKQVGQTFTAVKTPVITMEPHLYDDLNLTGNRAGQDFGLQSGKQQFAIRQNEHPLAAELTAGLTAEWGDELGAIAQIYSKPGTFGWGKPNRNGINIASLKADPSKSTVFGYEKGATLVDGNRASDRRVGLFLSDKKNEGQFLSNQGWQLFDAAVEWANQSSASSPVSGTASSPQASSPVLPGEPPTIAEPSPSISPTVSSTPSPAVRGESNGQFQVIGDKIYDPDGVEFIAKGVNKFTFTSGNTKQVDQIKNDWQFNTVRINYFLEGYVVDGKETQQLHQNIKSFSQNKVVTIIDLLDRTGKYWEGKDLGRLKTFFKDLAQRYKDNPYVWFNISNEPGGSKSVEQIDKWLTQHQEVIKVIRDEVGASNPIVVDAHFWGQDVGEWSSNPVRTSQSSILKYGDQVKQFDGKEYENIIFSIHAYDQWNFGEAKMADYFDRIEDKDHAVIVGEYGQINTTFSTRKATTALFNVAAPREIGRIAWVWSAKDGNDLTTTRNGGGEHINDDDNPTNLSWLGQRVWNDNRRKEDLEQL